VYFGSIKDQETKEEIDQNIKTLTIQKTQLLAELTTAYDKIFIIRSELEKYNRDCYDKHLIDIKFDPELITLIKETEQLKQNEKTIDEALNDLTRVCFKKITAGGWFQCSDFETDDDSRYTSKEKIRNWFLYKIVSFLNACDDGRVHLTEYGDTPDQRVPYRIWDETCELTFEWYRNRTEILIFKSDFLALYRELYVCKMAYTQQLNKLNKYIINSFFEEKKSTILHIMAETKEIYDHTYRLFRSKVHEIYDDNDLCQSDEHKVAMAILIDISGDAAYELKCSIIPVEPRHRWG
jgi:hypothetical protein